MPASTVHPLVQWALAVRYADLPDAAITSAKHMLLDTLACIIAAQQTDIRPVVQGACAPFGVGSLAAHSYRLARYADSMDMNEGYGGAHFGCGAVAALLALAQRQPISGKDALTALAVGFEVGARVTDAIGSYTTRPDGQPGFLDVWGIATPVVYAAAASALCVLHVDPETAVQGFALAGSLSPIPIGGLWSDALALPNTKYADAGFCAMTGVTAAWMARSGTTGVPGLLDQHKGLLAIVQAANANPNHLVPAPTDPWRITQALYKSWPCCGLMNGALHLLQNLMHAHSLRASDIVGMEVQVDASILIPRFLNKHPQTFASYQFSLPHTLTMIAFDVPAGPLWLSRDHVEQPHFVALREAVTIAPLADACARGSATLRIRSHQGEVSGAYTPDQAIPRKPRTRADFEEKFRRLATKALGAKVDACLAAVYALETCSSIQVLNDFLQKAGVHD